MAQDSDLIFLDFNELFSFASFNIININRENLALSQDTFFFLDTL
jgi:hypothetical protein